MNTKLIFAIQFGLNLLSYSLLMVWFVYPVLQQKGKYVALTPLIFFHCIRTLGITAVVPGVVGAKLAATNWAHHVAIGDITTVVLAMIAVAALRKQKSFAIPLVWLFNIVGFLDICNAGRNAVADNILPHAGPQWFVITFGVPALIVTHFFMFWILLRHPKNPQSLGGSEEPTS